MKVEYHPAVFDELRKIRDYYNEQSPGLGAAFVDEFERQVLGVSMEEAGNSPRKSLKRKRASRVPLVDVTLCLSASVREKLKS